MRITLIAAMLSVAFVSTALSLGSAVAAESDRNKVAQKPVGTQTASSRPKASNTPSSAKSKPASPPKKSTAAASSKPKAPVSSVKKTGGALATNAGPVSQDPTRLAVQSGAVLVIEQGGEHTFYQKNANAVVPIASITKLMTAMVVLDGIPDLQSTITIGEEDVDYLKGSSSRLRVGSTMSRETALLLALMSSENRASHALARHYPGGVPAFLAAMNIKALALGMRDTHFEDPTGLNSHNVSTAHDLAKMVAAAHRYPLIREFSTTPEAMVDVSGRELGFRNTNPLVRNTAWDVGLSKTGYISEAGKCLVMQARVADKPLVIVLLDSVGKMTRIGDANRIKRWLEHNYAAGKGTTKTAGGASVKVPG